MGGSGGVRRTSMMRSHRVSIKPSMSTLSYIAHGTFGALLVTNYEEDFCNMTFSGIGLE
jgi:hypothetical protein